MSRSETRDDTDPRADGGPTGTLSAYLSTAAGSVLLGLLFVLLL